jgi:hypothetical protein
LAIDRLLKVDLHKNEAGCTFFKMYEEIEDTFSETTASERPAAKIDEDRLLKLEQKMNEMFNNFQEENSFLRNKVYDLEKDAQVNMT